MHTRYVPIGTVLVNEEAASAFAGSDNDKRYHFNFDHIKTTDQLLVTFDANNLNTDGIPDPHTASRSISMVLVQPEIMIYLLIWIRISQLSRSLWQCERGWPGPITSSP